MASQGSPATAACAAQAMDLDNVATMEHRQAQGGDRGSSAGPAASESHQDPLFRSSSSKEAQKLDELKALVPKSVLGILRLALSEHGNDELREETERDLASSLERVLKEAERIHNERSRTQTLPAWLRRLCLGIYGEQRGCKRGWELFDLFKAWDPPTEDHDPDRTCVRLLLYLLRNSIKREDHIHGDMDEEQLDNLSAIFLMAPMHGSVHIAFLEKIATIYDTLLWRSSDSNSETDFQCYGPTVHVVQSSGTGKSRMVNEVCRMLPGISICFRSLCSPPGEGFPLGDDVMTEFITHERPGKHEKQAAAIALLAALLAALATEPSNAEQAYFWHEWGLRHGGWRSGSHYDQKRSGFFDEVIDKATLLLNRDANVIDELAREAKSMSKFTSSLCARWCVSAANALAERIEIAKALESAASLDELDKEAREYYRSKAVLFLGLDEATFLDKCSGIHLVHLRRALFELARLQSRLSIWTILVDTSAGVDVIVDPVDHEEFLPPLPPFFAFPFNVFAEENSPVPERACDFLHYGRLRKYGRPLWGTSECGDRDLTEYASMKLCQSRLFQLCYQNQAIAALSRRLWLELDAPDEDVGQTQRFNVPAWRNTAASMYELCVIAVRSHLGMMQSLHSSSRHISTKPSSEPMVSIAACAGFAEDYPMVLCALIDMINDWNVPDRTDMDTVIMRLVLIMARDFAYAEIDTKPLALRRQLVALPTVDFLRELLGDDKFGLPRSEAKKLARRVENTYVSFTHFVPASEHDEEISADDLQTYWTRTIALLYNRNRTGVDAIVPVYRGDPEGPFDPKSFSYVAFRVKLRQSLTQPTWTVELSTVGTSARSKKRAAPAAPNETIPPSQSEPTFAIESVKGNVWGPAIVGGTVDRERPLVIVMDLGVTRDTAPSNRLYTDLQISTSSVASKTLEEDRKARHLSKDAHRVELRKLAQKWLCEHHGRSTAKFAALHVPSFKDAYRRLFRRAMEGKSPDEIFTRLDPLIAECRRHKDLSDDEIEFRATWEATSSKHIECVPRC